jgi:hypothetical protein
MLVYVVLDELISEKREVQMTPEGHPHGHLSRMLGVVRCPVLGPLLLGVVFGGIPSGIVLGFLGLDALSPKLLAWLSPFAIVLVALSANLSVNRGLYRILWRAFLTSLSICVPVPTIVWTALAWNSGYQVFDPRNFPLIVAVFVICAVMITIPSWVLALVIENLKI